MSTTSTKLGPEDVVFLQVALRPHSARLADYIAKLVPADVGRVIDANDVVQDTFFEAAQLIRQMPRTDEASVWRWLVTIARHKLTDLIRSLRAAKRGGAGRLQHLDEAAALHGSVILLLEELAVHVRTPSKSAVRREFLSAFEHSMTDIEPAYQLAIRFRFIEGLSLSETATKMGRTEDSTKKLCLRGLQALRTRLRSASLFV